MCSATGSVLAKYKYARCFGFIFGQPLFFSGPAWLNLYVAAIHYLFVVYQTLALYHSLCADAFFINIFGLLKKKKLCVGSRIIRVIIY